MPVLEDPRHEIFAQALARGVSLRAASNEAKFFGGITRICERSQKPAIAARVVVIKEHRRWGGDFKLREVFDQLMALAKTAGDIGPGAGMAAAKALLAEAARIRLAIGEAQAAAQARAQALAAAAPLEPAALPPMFTRAEWMAEFGPKT
jgi:hypothetical protein